MSCERQTRVPTPYAAEPSPTLDDAFHALAHSDRRHILLELKEREPTEPIEIDELHRPNGAPERARIKLHHIHLPVLAEAGYIDWDPSTTTVRIGNAFEEIEPLIALVADHRSRLPGEW